MADIRIGPNQGKVTPADGADAALLEAFGQWKAAHRRYEALPIVAGAIESPEEAREGAIWSAAEEIVLEATARTTHGAAAQLMVALQFMSSEAVCRAIWDDDWPALEACERDLDRPERFVLAALRSLRAMPARSEVAGS